MGILSSVAAAFESVYTKNRLRYYTSEQLVFVFGTILPIKHKADWELIRQKNQAQINKDNTHENIIIVDCNYKVSEKFILNNKSTKKCDTPYAFLFEITQCYTNETVPLKMGAMKIRYNIRHIKTYNMETDVENIHI